LRRLGKPTREARTWQRYDRLFDRGIRTGAKALAFLVYVDARPGAAVAAGAR